MGTEVVSTEGGYCMQGTNKIREQHPFMEMEFHHAQCRLTHGPSQQLITEQSLSWD